MSSANTKKSDTRESAQTMGSAMDAGRESLESFAKISSDTATRQYEQAVAMTQEQLSKASSRLFQNYNDMTAMNQENLQAVMAASSSFARGFEAMSKQLMAYTQSNMEQNLATSKKLLGAKTAQEFADLQNEHARLQIDQALAESVKLTERTLQNAVEDFQPLQTRMR